MKKIILLASFAIIATSGILYAVNNNKKVSCCASKENCCTEQSCATDCTCGTECSGEDCACGCSCCE